MNHNLHNAPMPPLPDASTPAPPPVFRGRLALAVDRYGRSVLTLTIRCPHCRANHQHSWPAAHETDIAPQHRQAHCLRADSPFHGLDRGYFVAPSDNFTNRMALAAFVEQLNRDARRAARRQRAASAAPATT